MAWQNRKWADAGLRLAGIVLLAIALLVGRRLFAAPDPQARTTPLCYLLALIGMASMSAGTALVVLGHHLFDRVVLSARWTVHGSPRRRN
jgi:uncharacterized protein YjeT (DUF2065 family)